MRAPLSVIIPVLDFDKSLPSTLASLIEGLGEGIIRDVVLSGVDRTPLLDRLASDVGATFVTGARGRGAQLRRGADHASGQWLLFLHSDTVLSPGWSADVNHHMQSEPDFAAAFRLRFRSRDTGAALVARWANTRSRIFGLPYGDQGLLIARPLYQSVGGFRDIALMEDLPIASPLKGTIKLLHSTVETRAKT